MDDWSSQSQSPQKIWNKLELNPHLDENDIFYKVVTKWWKTIGDLNARSNGVKISDTVIDYPSVNFYNFKVIQSNAYLYGESTDIVNGGYDEMTVFNSTEVTYDDEIRLICSYDTNGVLRYNQTFGVAYGNSWPYVEPLYEDDGKAFLITIQTSSIPITSVFDGVNIESYPLQSFEFTIIKIDEFGKQAE